MRSLYAVMLGGTLMLTGCTDTDSPNTANTGSTVTDAGPADDTAEAAVRHIMEGVRAGQPVAAWNALPAGYQQDVNQLVQTFGTNMDPEVWKQVVTVLTSVQQLLTDKQQFIVNHPALAEGADPDTVKQGVTSTAALLTAIVNGLGDLESLKTFDGAKFMQTTGADVVTNLTALASLAPKDGPVQVSLFEDVEVETVTSTDTTATLKLISANGEEQTQDFVKHDGKWLPKDMVEDWDQQIAEARNSLNDLPAQAAQMKGQAMMMGGMVQGMLSPLQSAENQEQFNQAAAGLMGSAGMMFGGLGGGPGPGSEPVESPAQPADNGGSLSESLAEPEAESAAPPKESADEK